MLKFVQEFSLLASEEVGICGLLVWPKLKIIRWHQVGGDFSRSFLGKQQIHFFQKKCSKICLFKLNIGIVYFILRKFREICVFLRKIIVEDPIILDS